MEKEIKTKVYGLDESPNRPQVLQIFKFFNQLVIFLYYNNFKPHTIL
jgi:hypothetical protein